MNRKRNIDITNADQAQTELVEWAYVRHTHGGREHGHDWDDVLKDDLRMQRQHERKMKLREKLRHEKQNE
jgi:hypothetical protein